MTPLIILDPGHCGRTGGRPPATHPGLREDIIVHEYGAAAIHYLRSKGYDAVFSGPGTYAERQQRARRMDAAAYVALHVNSGSAGIYQRGQMPRGVCFYDHRAGATGGRGLAEKVSDRCAEHFPPPFRWVTTEATHGDWTASAYSLIRNLGPVPGMVFEPGFIDSAKHMKLWANPRGLGLALGMGIADFVGAA